MSYLNPRAVGRRLRTIRQDRAGSLRAAAQLTGVSDTVLRKLETAQSKNLYLDVLDPICRAYDFPLSLVLRGWPGRRLPDAAFSDDTDVAAAALELDVRRRLRRCRGTTGTPTVAALSGVEPSWLVRIESGEYRRIDLVRIARIADVLGISLVDDILFPHPNQLSECPEDDAAELGRIDPPRPS